MHPPAPHDLHAAPGDSLWLGLYFARLALDVFEPGDNSRPIAVIEQRCVHCANRDNLPSGLAIATAHALHVDLLALERQPAREREYLRNLAHWAYQFTPGVVIANRNSLLLEIGSCRRLHRGARNLLKKIQRSLQQRRQYAQIGLARTPKAAWLLAQCRCKPALRGDCVDDELLQRQCAMVPLDALEIDGDSQRALRQMGLTTFGALRELPTAALGKRFGADFVDYLQKVDGKKADPQVFFTPSPHFQHGLAFVDGVAQRQMLVFPMKRLLQSLTDYLRVRQLHCHTLHWQLFDAHRMQAEFSLELSRMQNHWHDLLELSRLKLDQVPLTATVFSINLFCEDFFAAAPTAQQLFPDANDQHEAAAALIDRLQARLGSEALQRITIQESHWPEYSWRSEGVNTAPSNRPPSKSLATKNYREMICTNHTADRSASTQFTKPLWLLPQPQSLTERDNHPCWPTPLTLLRGPERIDNHWWQEEKSERDYYVARNERGAVCWIFQNRETQRWFLHGLFG